MQSSKHNQSDDLKKLTLDTKNIVNMRNSKLIQSQNILSNSK